MLDKEPTPGGMVEFHTAPKLTLMAHPHQGRPSPGQALTRAGPHQDKQPEALHQDGPRGCRRGQARLGELTAEYGAQLMEGLSVLSPEQSEGMGTRGKHVNARRVQHLMGFLKNHLSSEDKAYRGWVHLR
jgi:uncharacterized protein YbgA (DUF1722 family)